MGDKIKSGVLITIFLLAILLPTAIYYIGGFNLDAQNKENRSLSEFPTLSLEKWDEFFPAVEEYVNDHAAFKNEFVKTNSLIDLFCFYSVERTDVLLGKDKWLFSSDYKSYSDPYMDYKNVTDISGEQLAAIASNVNALDQLSGGLGADFYLFIAPNKEQVYPEKMRDYIKVQSGPSRTQKTIEYINANTDITVVYPLDELVAEKSNYQTYLKYDTHWNPIGGFIGSQQLIEAITGSREYASDKQPEEVTGVSGDLATLMSLDDVLNDDTMYIRRKYKPEITVTTVENEQSGYYIHTKSDCGNGKTLLMICDSFNNSMRDYIAKNFSECYFIRREAYEEGMITEISPDIFVFEVVERLSNSVLTDYAVTVINGK